MRTERVAFINTEYGDKDLILSFAVQCPDEPESIESLILLRTPIFECFLMEHERGVNVSFERFKDADDELLLRFEYLKSEAIVRIQTTSRTYQLDVRKVDPDDLKGMGGLLRKMNFDGKFQLAGI